MTVTRPNTLIGCDFVVTGCLIVDPLETTDRLSKSPRLVGYPQSISSINEYDVMLYENKIIDGWNFRSFVCNNFEWLRFKKYFVSSNFFSYVYKKGCQTNLIASNNIFETFITYDVLKKFKKRKCNIYHTVALNFLMEQNLKMIPQTINIYSNSSAKYLV